MTHSLTEIKDRIMRLETEVAQIKQILKDPLPVWEKIAMEKRGALQQVAFHKEAEQLANRTEADLRVIIGGLQCENADLRRRLAAFDKGAEHVQP